MIRKSEPCSWEKLLRGVSDGRRTLYDHTGCGHRTAGPFAGGAYDATDGTDSFGDYQIYHCHECGAVIYERLGDYKASYQMGGDLPSDVSWETTDEEKREMVKDAFAELEEAL